MGNVGVAEIAQPISLMVSAKISGILASTLEATLAEDEFDTILERNGGFNGALFT